jgi:hypothetical protein
MKIPSKEMLQTRVFVMSHHMCIRVLQGFSIGRAEQFPKKRTKTVCCAKRSLFQTIIGSSLKAFVGWI